MVTGAGKGQRQTHAGHQLSFFIKLFLFFVFLCCLKELLVQNRTPRFTFHFACYISTPYKKIRLGKKQTMCLIVPVSLTLLIPELLFTYYLSKHVLKSYCGHCSLYKLKMIYVAEFTLRVRKLDCDQSIISTIQLSISKQKRKQNPEIPHSF